MLTLYGCVVCEPASTATRRCTVHWNCDSSSGTSADFKHHIHLQFEKSIAPANAVEAVAAAAIAAAAACIAAQAGTCVITFIAKRIQ